MNDKRKLLYTSLFLVVLLVCGYYLYNHLKTSVETKNEMAYIEVTPAKDFTIEATNRSFIQLSDFKDGKPIVVNFWSYKCSPCIQEMPTFQGLYEKYKDDVHFVLISTHSDKVATELFVEERQYTFPIYHDSRYEARKALSVPSLPTTYIIDGEFNVVRGGKGVVTYPMVEEVLEELMKGNEK